MPSLQDPQHVLTYLARYTHRVAISNHRLVALEDGQVTFRYKDYQRGHRLRTLTLEAVEFLRRLMLHVPPHGFHRLRHFGFLANRVRQEKLAQCRTLLGHATRPRAREAAVDREAPEVPAGEPGAACPVCQHGRMQLVQTLYRQPAAWDLSVPMRLAGHLIEEARRGRPKRVSLTAGLYRLEGRGASTAVCQGALPEAWRQQKRLVHDLTGTCCPPSSPCCRVDTPPRTASKEPLSSKQSP